VVEEKGMVVPQASLAPGLGKVLAAWMVPARLP